MDVLLLNMSVKSIDLGKKFVGDFEDRTAVQLNEGNPFLYEGR